MDSTLCLSCNTTVSCGPKKKVMEALKQNADILVDSPTKADEVLDWLVVAKSVVSRVEESLKRYMRDTGERDWEHNGVRAVFKKQAAILQSAKMVTWIDICEECGVPIQDAIESGRVPSITTIRKMDNDYPGLLERMTEKGLIREHEVFGIEDVPVKEKKSQQALS